MEKRIFSLVKVNGYEFKEIGKHPLPKLHSSASAGRWPIVADVGDDDDDDGYDADERQGHGAGAAKEDFVVALFGASINDVDSIAQGMEATI